MACTAHFYYHLDQLGSVRFTTHDLGGVHAFFSYGSYGSRFCDGDCTDKPRFGYAGQYTDPESGMQYLRARYYDSTTQQFISRDPMEGATGQPYAYANGNPVNVTDPSGNCPVCLFLVGVGLNVVADVGMDFVFDNANFNFWNSVGGSLSNPLTYLGSIPLKYAGRVGRLAQEITNPVPQRLARVVPGTRSLEALGRRVGEEGMRLVGFDNEHVARRQSNSLSLNPYHGGAPRHHVNLCYASVGVRLVHTFVGVADRHRQA